MNKKLKYYINSVDKILTEKDIHNLSKITSNHLQQIQFYQHERLIHLLVTGIFAILSMLSLLGAIAFCHFGLLLLFFLLLCLLIPYIFYYYTLENSVQKMYDQYWKLKEKE